MEKIDDGWRRYASPARALAIVDAAAKAGTGLGAVLDELELSESAIRMWRSGSVEQLRPAVARKVRRLARRIGKEKT